MKQATVCGIAMLFAMGGHVWAAVQVFEITADGVKCQFPDVSGRWVVWQDERNGSYTPDIYGYDLQTGQEFAVCTAPGEQRRPAVSGDLIVWQDKRSGKFEIYGYDLAADDPNTMEFVICPAEYSQEFPAVSGRRVVWGTRRESTKLDLYGADLQQGLVFEIASHPTASLMQPDIDGDWVVWYDNRSGIDQVYGCRLEFPIPEGGFEVICLCPSPYAQMFPAISGDTVVWHQKNDLGGTDIVGCHLQTGQSFTVFEGGKASNPAISDTLVVWQDNRNDIIKSDIFGCDLAGGGVFEISATVAQQRWPAVSGRQVVWEQDGQIWGAQVLEPTILTILSPEAGQMVLAGSVHPIRWQTEGPALEQVKLEFSPDDGANWHVIEPNVPDTGAYLWQIPEVDSSVCRVRVSDVEPSGAGGTSGMFVIFACDPALTADVNGDCRVDIADFAVFAEQWMQCGNRYNPDWCRQ